jgi:two-component system chemotaxis response regulator CheB
VSLAATETGRPRVVVADDSALMRRIVCDVLTRGGIDVVGTAADGDEALALCRSLSPDAMTLDLSMPGMGGIEVLRLLRASGRSLPVVVVSAFSPSQGAYAIDALAEGAFELVIKPGEAAGVGAFEEALISRLQLAVTPQRPPRERPASAAAALASIPPALALPQLPHPSPADRVVVIAISTGGPRALAALVPALPAPLGLGTLIVQHMPAGFTASLAARLDRGSAIRVREAADGDVLDPGVALVAPGGRHLRLLAGGRVTLSDAQPVGGLRPRADLLIEDVAALYGERLLLVVMTGMGNDGLRGATAVRHHGGRVIAEAEETCTVYGMPRVVADAQLADEVVPLHELADAIGAQVAA